MTSYPTRGTTANASESVYEPMATEVGPTEQDDSWVDPSAMVTTLSDEARVVTRLCEATKVVLTKLPVAPQSRRNTADRPSRRPANLTRGRVEWCSWLMARLPSERVHEVREDEVESEDEDENEVGRVIFDSWAGAMVTAAASGGPEGNGSAREEKRFWSWIPFSTGLTSLIAPTWCRRWPHGRAPCSASIRSRGDSARSRPSRCRGPWSTSRR